MAKVVKHTFYRPHARVQEFGTITNPHTGEVTQPPSLTKQEFVRECDINNVIKQYKQTGMVAHMNAKAAQGAYQDLPDATDFQESLHLVMAAEEAFMTLPAKIRDRFGQDPAEFLAFMSDPRNREEIKALGLTKPEPPPREPLEVVVKGSGEPLGGAGGTPPAGGAKAP